MVKYNPREQGNKPGIAIMIAVKKPKKGEKVKKNDEAAYYDDEVPRLLDLSQQGVGPVRMQRQSENINEMSNFGQGRMLDSTLSGQTPPRDTGVMTSRARAQPSGVGERKYRSMILPPGMSREDYRAYQKKLEDMMPKEPAPGKDFGSRLRSKIKNTGTVIETGEPMDLAWRLLKYDGQAGMDGLDDGGNYPDKSASVPEFAFRNDVTNNQTGERLNRPPPINWMKQPGVAKPTKEEILANQGFTPQAIAAQDAKNAAAVAAINNRRLFQPKGG